MSSAEIQIIMDELKKFRKEFESHTECARSHWEANKQFQTEMLPAREALHFLQTFQKFLKWVGITIARFITFIYWVFHRT